jgi:hypothetical protein
VPGPAYFPRGARIWFAGAAPYGRIKINWRSNFST